MKPGTVMNVSCASRDSSLKCLNGRKTVTLQGQPHPVFTPIKRTVNTVYPRRKERVIKYHPTLV